MQKRFSQVDSLVGFDIEVSKLYLGSHCTLLRKSYVVTFSWSKASKSAVAIGCDLAMSDFVGEGYVNL